MSRSALDFAPFTNVPFVPHLASVGALIAKRSGDRTDVLSSRLRKEGREMLAGVWIGGVAFVIL